MMLEEKSACVLEYISVFVQACVCVCVSFGGDGMFLACQVRSLESLADARSRASLYACVYHDNNLKMSRSASNSSHPIVISFPHIRSLHDTINLIHSPRAW